jgi:ABC-type phosphate transport system substrate-binding protein
MEHMESMMRSVSLGVVSLFLAAGIAASADAPSVPFKVIVSANVAGRSVPRDVLAQIYLGKVSRWGNGSPIVAVDLSSTLPVRQAFSEQIVGMPVEAVKNHWLRMGPGGPRPPLTRPSDEGVIAFVAAEQGGVGYVSLTTPLPASVREISVQ